MKALNLSTITAVLLLFTGLASAHEATGLAGGFSSGFMHPILGWDHVIAMVAVGFGAPSWAAPPSGFCRSSSRWLWPLAVHWV